MKAVSAYHQQRASELGIQPLLSLVSNGVWSKTVFNWVVANVDRLTISCDGPVDIQNLHRPLKNGRGSSQFVHRTLQRLKETQTNFGIRSTITEHNVGRMAEMVQFFHDLCHPRTLQFERLAVCGRAEDNAMQPGTAEEFIENFTTAYDLAESLGISLACSGIRIFRRTNHYCGAAGLTLCVTPEGLFTTCHRVDNLADPLANEFIYGQWDGSGFHYDADKLADLRQRLSVEQNSLCENCFCKFTCAGGCYAARYTETGSLLGTQADERCKITRELTRHQLIRLANKRGLINQLHHGG
jgi:radical SAM protein with 4Fe4S-binding SPASM domain